MYSMAFLEKKKKVLTLLSVESQLFGAILGLLLLLFVGTSSFIPQGRLFRVHEMRKLSWRIAVVLQATVQDCQI